LNVIETLLTEEQANDGIGILFVCRSNAGRSQIAEAYCAKLTRMTDIASAGVKVVEENRQGAFLHPDIIEVGATLGLDLARKTRKQVTPEMLRRAKTVVVLMSESERKEHLPAYFEDFEGKIIYAPVDDVRGNPDEPRPKEKLLKMAKEIAKMVWDLNEQEGWQARAQ
jgi:protein-tyrosine-phosphatase